MAEAASSSTSPSSRRPSVAGARRASLGIPAPVPGSEGLEMNPNFLLGNSFQRLGLGEGQIGAPKEDVVVTEGKQMPVGAYVKSFGAPQKEGATVTGLSARFEADVGVTAASAGAPFRRASIISAALAQYMDVELGQLKERPPSEVSKHQVAALTPSWASWEDRGGACPR